MGYSSKNRRRSLLIPKDFQQRLILIPALSLIIVINVIASTLYLTIPESTFAPTPGILLILAVCELLLLGLFIAFVAVLSHRIAGPAYNLSLAMDKLGNKDLTTRVVFRANDFNHGLADAFNNSTIKLGESISEIKAVANALNQQGLDQMEREQLIEALCEKLSKFST